MRCRFTCIAALCCFLLPPLNAQSRRALVIGINAYQTRPPAPVEGPVVQTSANRKQAGRGVWANLDGAVSDAVLFRQLLIDRYGFRPEDIVFLSDKKTTATNGVATADQIRSLFEKHLIEEANPGDVSVFYYAGHGSRVRNLKTEEPDGLDETFVPADSEDGTPDIRDKELARLYRKAAQKGVVLTVIADSCHSGGVSRGVGPIAKTRKLADDPHEISDPPDVDPTTGQPLPDPTDLGVLVIAAAQDDQTAEEMYVEGEPHGVFTNFLTRAMRGAPVNESVSNLFARTLALMRAEGRMQLPAIAGEGRLERSLFGAPVSTENGTQVAVQEVRSDGTVKLRGGVALGLQEGTELVRTGEQAAHIRVESRPSLADATARVIDGGPVNAGDMFRIERWVVAPDLKTRFYLPAGELPSQEKLAALLVTIQKAASQQSLALIADPTEATPTYILQRSPDQWRLESRSGQNTPAIELGPWPDETSLVKAFSGKAGSLFVDFPPFDELAARIRKEIESAADAVEFVARPEEASYQLAGAAQGSRIVYAWVLSNAAGPAAAELPIPLRTEWISLDAAEAAARLAQFSLNIARLRLWLNIDVPGDNEFPYKLELRNLDSGEIRTSGVLVEDETFDVVLRASKEALASAGSISRWVYLLLIDRSGGMQILYPRGENSSENRVPRGNEPSEEVVLLKKLKVSEPFGVDTMILLASEEPVDPFALRIDPVRKQSASGGRGAPGTLSAFLFQMQSGARGFSSAAPTNWSIERSTFRTVSKTSTSTSTR